VAVTFKIRVEHRGAATAVRIAGELDMATAPMLAGCVNDLIAANSTRVLVELDELTFCDSAGLTVLIQGDRQCAAHGGWLRVSGSSGHVARVLEISGLEELLTYRADIDRQA
jgi:anti-anti-sigma factor